MSNPDSHDQIKAEMLLIVRANADNKSPEGLFKIIKERLPGVPMQVISKRLGELLESLQ